MAAEPPVSVVVPTRDRPELLRRAVTAILAQTYGAQSSAWSCSTRATPTCPGPTCRPAAACTWSATSAPPAWPGPATAASWPPPASWSPSATTTSGCPEAGPAGRTAAGDAVGGRLHHRHPGPLPGPHHTRLAPTVLVTHRQLLRSRLTELHPSTVLARRRQLLEDIGLVDEEIPGSYAEDYEWLLRASRHGPVLAVPEPLAVIHWHRSSFFADRWTYLVDKHQDLKAEPSGLARIYGQIAFAHAALGERRPARRWARRTLSLNRRERRAYLAIAISLGLVSAKNVVRMAHVAGKGI